MALSIFGTLYPLKILLYIYVLWICVFRTLSLVENWLKIDGVRPTQSRTDMPMFFVLQGSLLQTALTLQPCVSQA